MKKTIFTATFLLSVAGSADADAKFQDLHISSGMKRVATNTITKYGLRKTKDLRSKESNKKPSCR